MELKKLRELLDLMKEYDLSEMELEDDKDYYKFSRRPQHLEVPPAVVAPQPPPVPVQVSQPAPVAVKMLEIKAPMVGTLYRASAPDAAPFVEVGESVSPETVVCIIEAMKVMNEIKAEVAGTVRKVLVDNAQPVEYGQVLFLVEPA